MADADAATTEDTTKVRLQVAAARQEESGQGIARMPRSAFQALGITEGDVVEITGKRTTAAVAMAAYDEDQTIDVVRLDGLQRGNAEAGSGEHVNVSVAESRPATRVVFAPAQREMRLQGPAQALKRNFFRKPLVAGDLVATTGQQPVQDMPPEVRRMFNAPAYALTQIRLSVVSTSPKGIVHIDENTEVELRAEFEAPRDARAVVNYDDVGGMEDTIQQLREMVELPLRYPELFTRLGVDPPKGVLLHGPPGTGKTLIARQIGKMLNGKEPKIVNGPEVLSKYVGQSEENIRNLFAEADAEYAERGDDSDLHIIIFDEIDAVCKARGSVNSGTGVHDSIVNQLLTKIDGVDALNNILLIGMTNRRDMLDEAILRPGRLEVHIEIGLPDEAGRTQILKIHSAKMSENEFLGQDVDVADLARRTKNFSGAEIEGLVKSAVSFALSRQVDFQNLGSMEIDEDNVKIEHADFERALGEVQPAFGAATDTFERCRLNGIISPGEKFEKLHHTCRALVEQVRVSEKTPMLTCLLEGGSGSGKTALAATLAIGSEFPFMKLVSADTMVGQSEMAKCQALSKVFEDAYKSPLSLIVLDDIERLLEYVAIGPRFSNVVLQALLILLKQLLSLSHSARLGTAAHPLGASVACSARRCRPATWRARARGRALGQA